MYQRTERCLVDGRAQVDFIDQYNTSWTYETVQVIVLSVIYKYVVKEQPALVSSSFMINTKDKSTEVCSPCLFSSTVSNWTAQLSCVGRFLLLVYSSHWWPSATIPQSNFHIVSPATLSPKGFHSPAHAPAWVSCPVSPRPSNTSPDINYARGTQSHLSCLKMFLKSVT